MQNHFAARGRPAFLYASPYFLSVPSAISSLLPSAARFPNDPYRCILGLSSLDLITPVTPTFSAPSEEYCEMKPRPITDYAMAPHARWELSRRGLSETTIRAILSAPEQRFDVRPGRVVLQSRVSSGQSAKMFLIRVFVDIDRVPAEVVTAYQTSKIEKYWRKDT